MARKRKREDQIPSEHIEAGEKEVHVSHSTNSDLSAPQLLTDLDSTLQEINRAFAATTLVQQPLLDGKSTDLVNRLIESL
jgi:hypothetical protein